jgi:phosphohistidine phosphatase SixA
MPNSTEQTPPRKSLAGLRRRPLLMPVWLTLLLPVAILAAGAWLWSFTTTTTVIVLRHAEKELGTIDDPPLSTAGEQRAQLLARMFGGDSTGTHVDAIFISDTRRSAQTAAPLAQRLHLTAETYAARDIDGLVSRIHSARRGRTSIVIGHSNTVPEIVHRLAPDVVVPALGENEYDAIFIVSVPTLGPARVLRLRY